MFELVQALSFILKKQFSVFGQNLPKVGVFGSAQKKWTSPLNSACSNQPRWQILSETDNFDFLNHIFQKSLFPHKAGQNGHYHKIQHIRISLGTNFHLKLTFLILDQIYPKRIFPVGNKTNGFDHPLRIRISLHLSFILNRQL